MSLLYLLQIYNNIYFKGRKFCEVREFGPFSRKFMPLDTVIGKNRGSFFRKIRLKIQIRESFFREIPLKYGQPNHDIFLPS